MANHKGSGTPENFQEQQQKHTDCINNKMLGKLVDMYTSGILQDAGDPPVESYDEQDAPWFSFTYRRSGDSEFLETMRRDLKLMTEERNELVHCFLPRWQPDSPEKMEETLAYLDAQRERVKPMFDYLQNSIGQMQATQTLLKNIMASPEFERQFELMWLQSSQLVSLLSEVSQKIQRADGWTYLADAGRVAANELPDDVKNILARYGHKTLKKLLVGSELFEVFDKPLPNGNFHTLYRLKPVEPKLPEQI